MRLLLAMLLTISCYMTSAQAVLIQEVNAHFLQDGDSCNAILATKVRLGSTGCWLKGYNVNVEGDTVLLDACYDSGMFSATCTRYDTFCLGNLPIGAYIVKLVASRTDNGVDCDVTNWRNTAFTTLQIGPVGIKELGGDNIIATLRGYNSLNLNTSHPGTAGIKVYDALGRLHHSSNTQVSVGKNDIDLDIPNLPRGLYLYHIQLGQQRKVLKYVKQ
ncbi:MAG: T9SS type A sorting domain-containing protein [Bacteroidetes bacterium]|nr:T9SS type A sorting domain-containing protein [Bacteroidota bacterium]